MKAPDAVAYIDSTKGAIMTTDRTGARMLARLPAGYYDRARILSPGTH